MKLEFRRRDGSELRIELDKALDKAIAGWISLPVVIVLMLVWLLAGHGRVPW
jgi:hypothetical protein